jgi:hypothetical protein
MSIVSPCMTSSTNIFVAIAAACFAYMCLIIPATTKMSKYPHLLIYATILLYCGIFPIMTIYSGSVNTTISGDNGFITLKLLSVIFFILILLYFSVHTSSQSITFKGYNVMSIVLSSLLIINIFEAVVDQGSRSNMSNYEGKLNIVNTVTGLLLIISLIRMNPAMSIKSTSTNLSLVSSLTTKFIIAYTLWNLLFRIDLVENSSILIFTSVSLVVPLMCHLLHKGDWLQTRALTLLLVMLLTFGVGYGQYSIFPAYNKLGYDKSADMSDLPTQMFSDDIFKGLVASSAFIITLYSCK